jgi:hypothetical protein
MAHRLVPIALAFLLIVSCGKREETTSPAPAPAPASTSSPATTPAAAPATSTAAAAAPAPAPVAGGIASADADKPGVKVTITELKRSAGGTLSLKAVISNASDDSYGFGAQFEEPGHTGTDYGTISGVCVVDPVGKKKYFVARDSDGHPLCSGDLHDINQGKSSNVWAKFAAPPDDVQKVTVLFPHFQPLDDVPISK